MPFFYSQYLKDEKTKQKGKGSKSPSGSGRKGNPATGATGARRPSLTKSPSSGNGGSSNGVGRLIWHSNIGASGKRHAKGRAGDRFKPLKYSADGKKVVHFSTIEVQPFHFDWDTAKDVYYTRAELTAMGQSRFDDAATLRRQRNLDIEKKSRGGDGVPRTQSIDDLDTSKKSKVGDIATQLALALDDEDRDDSVSIRGIEHFVYPDLQQEMIRRKKQVQREVLDFIRSRRPDPQGWRLAEHSRVHSQWARNVAMEKGMKYSMNNSKWDPDVNLSEDELERIKKSQDELEMCTRSLRGNCSFNCPSTSASFEEASSIDESDVNRLRKLSEESASLSGEIAGKNKLERLEEVSEHRSDDCESEQHQSAGEQHQPAGDDTGEE